MTLEGFYTVSAFDSRHNARHVFATWCIFVYFDSIVDKPQQFIEGDNKDIDVIILIIKDAYSRTGEF